MLVVDGADELLDQVFERDQAGDAAVLVEDDGDLGPLDAELFEQVVGVLGLGDAVRRAGELAGDDDGVGVVGVGHPGEEVLGVEDADDVVAVLAVERDPALARLAEGLRGGPGGDRRRAAS